MSSISRATTATFAVEPPAAPAGAALAGGTAIGGGAGGASGAGAFPGGAASTGIAWATVVGVYSPAFAASAWSCMPPMGAPGATGGASAAALAPQALAKKAIHKDTLNLAIKRPPWAPNEG